MLTLKNFIKWNSDTIPKSLRYKVITILSWTYSPKILCQIAEVSLSGYYKYKSLVFSKQTKDDKEKWDVLLIQKLALKYNKRYWYRIITMMLLSQNKRNINHKKVLRLMKKYSLLSEVRKRNPYKQIAKATQEHRECKNILERKFKSMIPRKKLGTDITYLYYSKREKAYLSVLKDFETGEIISHKVSRNLWLEFVLQTIQNVIHTLSKWSLIHSDQWWHYTHPSYQWLLRTNEIVQSMSRKWNCLDNAPTESFFGHLKDEIDISSCNTFEELEIYIENYIFEYNNLRPQWSRKKMTPVQYRNHLLNLT